MTRSRHGKRGGPRPPRLQRVAQALSLGAFLWLLWRAGAPGAAQRPPGGVEFFLWLDPLGAVVTWIAGRTWLPAFAWGLGILALTAVLGRLFCGHVCPLGATVDAADALGPKRPKARPGALPASRRRWKYLVLAALLTAAALGLSLAFAAAPLSLATRFYGLVVLPAAGHAAEAVFSLSRPVADALDWRWLLHTQARAPRFATALFVALFVGGILALGRIAPRFWCRALCPAGALMALTCAAPLLRRTVSDACTECGACRRACPMDAIHEDPRHSSPRECVSCLKCVRVCPEDAVHFRLRGGARGGAEFLPARRAVLGAGAAGAGLAALSAVGLVPARPQPVAGFPASDALIRPPGSVPEADFLARCVRCGECAAACPTNMLQPTWDAAGPWGVFSPVAAPRSGPCAPECARCGTVCPTRAIRPLPLADKTWAKMGTAVVVRDKCLAWEHGKSCLVCDETCPYGAVRLRRTPDSPVAVPFVDKDRCAGCGACEHHCPVRNEAAIVVTPMNALRLARGSFEDAGRRMGLDIRRKPPKPAYGYEPQHAPGGADAPGAPPGFDPPSEADPPPGFDPPADAGSPPGFDAPSESAPPPGFDAPSQSKP